MTKITLGQNLHLNAHLVLYMLLGQQDQQDQQDQQNQQHLLAAQIRYGEMIIISEEHHGESLHLLPCHPYHLLVLNQTIHQKESQRSSMTINLTRLQMATELQQLIVRLVS